MVVQVFSIFLGVKNLCTSLEADRKLRPRTCAAFINSSSIMILQKPEERQEYNFLKNQAVGFENAGSVVKSNNLFLYPRYCFTSSLAAAKDGRCRKTQ